MRNHLKFDLRLFLLFGLAALILIASVLLVMNYRNSKLEIEQSYISAIKNEYEIIMGVYAVMTDYIYDLHINAPEIKELFAQGVRSQDSAEKDRCRQLLYRRLSGLYQRLVHYDFRQLHFHEGNNKSYLRFHRPEIYGDDLTDARYLVAHVNSEKKPISGFEVGTVYDGYKFVYPVWVDGKHMGSVEFGLSMNAVIRHFRERFVQASQFVILKHRVVKKIFASEQSHYAPWFVDDAYLLDRSISSQCILENRITERDAVRIKTALAANRENGRPFCLEIKVDLIPRLLTFLPIKNFNGEIEAYIFNISGVKKILNLKIHFYLVLGALTALLIMLVLFILYYRFSQTQFEKMATFDSLTQAYSRIALMQMIDAEYARYKRYRTPFSLIMIDIDHFKDINDTYGHNTGDMVLAGIAEIMKRSVRKSDCIGRYGGEEFIAFLPETEEKSAATVAEHLRQKVSEHIFHDIGNVTVSCGVAEMSEQTRSTEELINAADKKLYAAKKEGRNKVVV